MAEPARPPPPRPTPAPHPRPRQAVPVEPRARDAYTYGMGPLYDSLCCCCFQVPMLVDVQTGFEIDLGEDGTQEWATEFCFGWATYRDPALDRCLWCPMFFPGACCLPQLLLGMNLTLLTEEPYYNTWLCEQRGGLQLGDRGCSFCCMLTVGSLFYFGTVATFVSFCLERRFIMRRYNIRGKDNPCCWMLGFCYPCALFQHYAHLRTFGYHHHKTPVVQGAEHEPLLAETRVVVGQPRAEPVSAVVIIEENPDGPVVVGVATAVS